MERQFKVAARYRPYVEAELALILANVGRDMKQREEGRGSRIPDLFINRELLGNATIRVTSPEPTSKRIARPRRTGAIA